MAVVVAVCRVWHGKVQARGTQTAAETAGNEPSIGTVTVNGTRVGQGPRQSSERQQVRHPRQQAPGPASCTVSLRLKCITQKWQEFSRAVSRMHQVMEAQVFQAAHGHQMWSW